MSASPLGAVGWACTQLPCQSPYHHHDLPGSPCQLLVTPRGLQRLPAGRQKASLPLLWLPALDPAGEDPQRYQPEEMRAVINCRSHEALQLLVSHRTCNCPPAA